MNKIILLVGDGNHQFVYYLAKYLKTYENSQVHLLSFTYVKNESNYFDKVYYCGKGNSSNKAGSLKSMLRLFFFFLKYKNYYSVISFQFVRPIYYYLFKLRLLNNNHNTVMSVWGSDILLPTIDKNKLSYILEKSKKVTCATLKVKDKVKELSEKQKNIYIIKYGLEPLEYIKRLSDTSQHCKKKLGIEIKKLVVTIGHNASPNNQHINCINEFGRYFTSEQLKDIVFIIPLTYGRDVDYIKCLKKAVDSNGLDVIYYESYMSDFRVALLRKATDIYINVQHTDMLSGAMQEHIYAGSRVITGCWLDYRELKDIGVKLIEVDSIEELPKIIIEQKKYLFNISNNSSVIYNLSSWNNVINGWANALFN